MTPWVLAGTTFFASGVEFIEAATIVLAVAVTQGWRSAIGGTIAATVALFVLVAIGTPILMNAVDLQRLELIVGPFLILFGIGWLRKAVWRYAGRKALHDEDAIFRREVEHLSARREERYGFAVAFQGVFVEGLEVAVIVATFAASTPALIAWSTGGAIIALAAVVIATIALRTPFSKVPENLLKGVVGVMLLSLGTFWTGEGAHITWPLEDATLFAFIAGYAILSLVLVAVQRKLFHARS
jgi:Ca2+/H+ antiporter, TMEM165/GDT1 family